MCCAAGLHGGYCPRTSRRGRRSTAGLPGFVTNACSSGSTTRWSRSTASEPEDDALTVEDLAHTVYHCLGIDADKKLMSPGDRPIDIVREGHTRKELLA